MKSYIKGLIATSLLVPAWVPTTVAAQVQCEATEIIQPNPDINDIDEPLDPRPDAPERQATPEDATTSAGGCFLAGRAAAILNYQPNLQTRRNGQDFGVYATQAGDITDTQGYSGPLWLSLGVGASELEGAELEQGVVTMGGDLFFNDTTIYGMMLQSDVAYQDGPSNNSFDATGVMVGLYAIFIRDTLAFDGRIMGGGSSTDVTEGADSVDDIESTRWLVTGQVSNQIDIGGGQLLMPHLSVGWFEDTMDSYTINSIFVPEKTIKYGQADIGATWLLPITMGESDGNIILGASGIMGFGEAAGDEVPDDLRARVDVGMELFQIDEWSASARIFNDGIGLDNFEAFGADLGVTLWF